MSLIEKAADMAGKAGVVAIPTTSVAEKAGWLGDVTVIQMISAAGVIWLIIDRTIRLYWDWKDRGARNGTNDNAG